MNEKLKKLEQIYLLWRNFDRLDEKTWQFLPQLNYRLESEIKTDNGTWHLYTAEKNIYYNPQKNGKYTVKLFFAVFSPSGSGRSLPVSGTYEDLASLTGYLRDISLNLAIEERTGFFRLTRENAQDYGYIRGIVFGFLLLALDLTFAWIFRLKTGGVLMTFLDYTKLVYEGSPSFAIVVGMAAMGVYFCMLFIFFPILIANVYIFKARKIHEAKSNKIHDAVLEYDFGKRAEDSLKDQYQAMLEDLRTSEIYEYINRKPGEMKKEDFIYIYNRIKEGFLTPESLYRFLTEMEEKMPGYDLKKLLELMLHYSHAEPRVDLRISEVDSEQTV